LFRTILLIDINSNQEAIDKLRKQCKVLKTASTLFEMETVIHVVDAVVLRMNRIQMREWQRNIVALRHLPIFWYVLEQANSVDIEWGYALDGLLFPYQPTETLGYVFSFGMRNFNQRKHWAEERKKLMLKIEERKWIDQAKAVLCEVKNITEQEAYEFLRRQAMDERKRMGDVAASIVKVYQLMHG
jgi:response regulator NasT